MRYGPARAGGLSSTLDTSRGLLTTLRFIIIVIIITAAIVTIITIIGTNIVSHRVVYAR